MHVSRDDNSIDGDGAGAPLHVHGTNDHADHADHAHSRAHACQPLGEVVVAVRAALFGYSGHAAVSVADLEIRAGEVVALLGPNGSGKTTLMKGMLGLVDRIDGNVELFGSDVDRLRDRSAVGYLPQRQSAAGPIPVTVNELVRSGRLTRRNPFGLGHDDGEIAQALQHVGLAAEARKRVSTLSGGQQRRALLARALVGGARLLMLDEPFAGVDQRNQEDIADALDVLLHEGLTLVVVLHELGPLEPLVTRVVCMDGGRIAYDGPIGDAPPELLHLGHDHDPHGGPVAPQGIGLVG